MIGNAFLRIVFLKFAPGGRQEICRFSRSNLFADQRLLAGERRQRDGR